MLFATVTVGRQVVVGHTSTLVLSWAGGAIGIWWLGVYVRELNARRGLGLLPTAVLGGLVLLVAGQTALHGLDVPLLAGGAGAVAGIAQAALLLAMVAWMRRGSAADLAAPGSPWGLVAIGPFLIVELVLLANLGRVEVVSGLDAGAAGAVALAGLVLGIASLRWSISWPVRAGLGPLAVALTVPGIAAGWWAGPALVLAELGLVQGVAGAFVTRPGAAPALARRLYGAAVAGALLLFVLPFAYYSAYGLPALWPVAVALTVAAGAWRSRPIAIREYRWILAIVGVALSGLFASFVPSAAMSPAALATAPAQLRILSYNVFQGLDGEDLPDMQALGDYIAEQNVDIASLYEVNRGWNLSGGVEMVAYLRWRLPNYHVAIGDTGDALYVNLILSRAPIAETGTSLYPSGAGMRRSYVWARIPTQAGDLLYIATHLSHLSAQDRLTEAEGLQAFWGQRPHTIVAGDFNAPPDEPAMQRLVAAGFGDVLAAFTA